MRVIYKYVFLCVVRGGSFESFTYEWVDAGYVLPLTGKKTYNKNNKEKTSKTETQKEAKVYF